PCARYCVSCRELCHVRRIRRDKVASSGSAPANMEAVRATNTTAVRIGLTTISTEVCFRLFRPLLTDQSWEKENTDSSASYGSRRWQVKVARSGALAFAPHALQPSHGASVSSLNGESAQ